MNEPVVALDDLNSEDKEDYRLTEIIAGLKEKKDRVYLISQKNSQIPIPSYEEVKEAGVVIEKGSEVRIVELFNRLIKMGYYPSADIMLRKGECRRSGGVINVFPPNHDHVVKIEMDYDTVAGIWYFDQETKQLGKELKKIDILPINITGTGGGLLENCGPDDLIIVDDIDEEEQFIDILNRLEVNKLHFTSFPKSDEEYFHLRYLSVLKYYNIFDLLNDLRDKVQRDWKINILTKRTKELINIFSEENIRYGTKPNDEAKIILIDAGDLENVPASFQAPQQKIQFLTDKEIFNLSKTARNQSVQKINLEFLTGLRIGDLIVHLDHGIGRFLGVVPKTIDEIKREYLEIAYAENDRLFVPIDQADKISKYIGGEDNEPQLSRLGAVDWKNVSQKVKKETQKIAKALLKLYAERAQVKGHNYGLDTDRQKKFEKAFPYEETPGQMKAILDVKHDMESDKPMDRLVCGDVGFGKTEVAMRAAVKAVEGGKQVAFISPVTILADQHLKSFNKRAAGIDIRIEMLSRFRTPREQKEILGRLRKGDIDILIGTHRLLQDDVKFFNLGLVIIDEEQRFGVRQKEKFKEIRSQVDILTLTATPIPRTLNLALNNFRDISTITTPPPGRLPIITEVRRYSDNLIIEAIRKEVERDGKVYFLHNRVETIESIAGKFRKLMPDVKFIVAHGQLQSQDLEDRILHFKEGEYQVLISSTIIENGIDLPTANTLVVDNAENLGLSQMYQLRGRIGRGKIQAYAYFLYQSRQLRLDAKKRLKAIVDASELGAGFQVAMRDMEIRGAGDILGVNQHGTIKVVGMNHFLRMLNKTIEELKAGKISVEEPHIQDISIELPLPAYIPDTFIPDTKDKINVYQKLSSVDNIELLNELKEDLMTEYGHFPKEVSNLLQILEIKIYAKQAGLVNVKSIPMGNAGRQIILHMSNAVTAEQIMNMLKYNPKWLISGEKLKIDIKELGFNWPEKLKENVQLLLPRKENEKSLQ
ncbi:transcription-repair coupling factor [Patescibacteria group bacterium]|nr:transcription-repair coupling factor [Patescibacteria group bacterium]MBU1015749.1 transcription-repair coupling factor [Patescibacteria group bacterium]MBU1685511.1 transcription-repair coupling factor [Patescibacteria group bacterium]MBU1938703.1 transcription-repair coupling factor [Patescibacteria group bacterium]